MRRVVLRSRRHFSARVCCDAADREGEAGGLPRTERLAEKPVVLSRTAATVEAHTKAAVPGLASSAWDIAPASSKEHAMATA
jgi:hypothetical protein